MSRGRQFKVTVTKEDLVFAAAHFITLPGHRCEALHGHNYRAGIVVEGGLEPESWFVVDFAALKRVMKRLTDELDHKVLLPTTNPKLSVQAGPRRVTVSWDGEERYAFPAGDCVLLPLANTTVEQLAEYLACRAKQELAAQGITNLTALELEVEENFGQSASYREALG